MSGSGESVFEWQDPPGALRGKNRDGIWCERLAPCLEQPGRWACVWKGDGSSANNVAANLRRRQVIRPDGKWDFVSRDGSVYACYLGEDGE